MPAPKKATRTQVINHIKKAEVQLANGKSVKEVCKGLSVSEQTYYRWLRDLGVKTLSIESGSRWRNGPDESFNGTLGDEVLKREIFFTVTEAKVLIEQWQWEYNTIRPHSSLGYRPPAPEAVRHDPAFQNLPALCGPHLQRQE